MQRTSYFLISNYLLLKKAVQNGQLSLLSLEDTIFLKNLWLDRWTVWQSTSSVLMLMTNSSRTSAPYNQPCLFSSRGLAGCSAHLGGDLPMYPGDSWPRLGSARAAR